MAKEITTLVHAGRWLEATHLAADGRKLSKLEYYLDHYYKTLEFIEKVMKGDEFTKQMLYGIDIFEMRKKEEAFLSSIFLDAIRQRDGQKILEIANAVWSLKRNNPPGGIADAETTLLIVLKQFLDFSRRGMYIKQIVDFLENKTGKRIEGAGDGYSALRRKLKRLNFPLMPSRKLSTKKSF